MRNWYMTVTLKRGLWSLQQVCVYPNTLHEVSSVYRGAYVTLRDEGMCTEYNTRSTHRRPRLFHSCFHIVLFMPQRRHSRNCYGAWEISIWCVSTFISAFRQSCCQYCYAAPWKWVLLHMLIVAQLFTIVPQPFWKVNCRNIIVLWDVRRFAVSDRWRCSYCFRMYECCLFWLIFTLLQRRWKQRIFPASS